MDMRALGPGRDSDRGIADGGKKGSGANSDQGQEVYQSVARALVPGYDRDRGMAV